MVAWSLAIALIVRSGALQQAYRRLAGTLHDIQNMAQNLQTENSPIHSGENRMDQSFKKNIAPGFADGWAPKPA